MQGFNRQYSGGGRSGYGGGGGGGGQPFGGGGGYGGGYDNRGSPMGSGGGPMRGSGGGYPDNRGIMNWGGSGMGSSYGSNNYDRNMGPGPGYGSNGQQGRSGPDLRESLNTMRVGGRENTLALGILDAVKSLGVALDGPNQRGGGGFSPQSSRQGPPQQGFGGRQDLMRPNLQQSNRTLVQLTHTGGQMPPGPNQGPMMRGPQQNWNKNPNVANRAGPKGNMIKRLSNNQINKNKLQQNKKFQNKNISVKAAANKIVKNKSPKKEAEKINTVVEKTTVGENGTAEVTESTESSEIPSEKKNDDTPKEALACHMCGMENFASVTAYLNHLESQNHQQLTELFHAKGRATLQLLQANAALACQRIMNNSRKIGVKGRILECFKCKCRIPFTLAKHIKSPEHQLVVNFMAEKCCGRTYNNREDLEEHKLSLVHLRRQLACEARNEKQEQIEALGMEGLTTEEQQAALNDQVQEDVNAAHVNVESHYTPDTIPIYDPDTALGKNFVLSKTQYHCRCCKQQFPPGSNALENHCRSSNHYEHLQTYVKQQAERKQQGQLETKVAENNDTDDSAAENEVKKEEKLESDNKEKINKEENNKEENNKEEEKDVEEEPEVDLDAMELIDIPLDGVKLEEEEEEEWVNDDEDEKEDEEEELLGEEEMEDDILGNHDAVLHEEPENDEAEEEVSTEEKTAASEETNTVDEEAEVEEELDYEMGVDSPMSNHDEDEDDESEEEDDEEEINPKRRARGSTKSTPAKRSLTVAPAHRGRRN